MSKKVISEWNPTTNALEVGLLGKLIEELNECGSAAARCLIQGLDEKEPTTGEVNRRWLEKELADVAAMIDNITTRLNLDVQLINLRMLEKISFKAPWFDYLERR